MTPSNVMIYGRESEALFGALARLDRMLDRAVSAADAAYSGNASTDPYRGLYISSDEVKRLLARVPGAPVLSCGAEGSVAAHPRFSLLEREFGLDSFDLDVVLVALAPEIDIRYERIYAYLQDDVTRRRPSVDLVLNLLCATRDAKLMARSRFSPDSKLVRNRLLRLVSDGSALEPPLLAHYLKLDDAVVRYLIGEHCLSASLAAVATLTRPKSNGADYRQVGDLLAAVERICAQHDMARRPLRVYFAGPRTSLKQKAADALGTHLDRPVLRVNLERAAALPDFEATLDLLTRETRLHGAVLYLERLDALRNSDTLAALQAALERLEELPSITILEGEKPWPADLGTATVVRFGSLDFSERRACWAAGLTAAQLTVDSKLADELACRYRLTAGQVYRAVDSAASQAALENRAPALDDFANAARAQFTHDLGPMAAKVAPVYTWNDIVLPGEQVEQLRDICNQVRFRHVVLGTWGFDRKLSMGKGVSALFSGPPGTGKTMAAEILANDLGLDLYKIDLSQVVSKYIGETEKNLNRVFDEARAGNLILFFDECDALFGKRTEVRDAHDRYANIEISYLLQKMEEHTGLSILATNLKQNLDAAFTRRLTFMVEFPFPDEASRRRIWRAIWPREAPLAGSVDLDNVACQLKISGGAVKNIAIAAAFLAAAEKSSEVRTEHLARAARRELDKTGRPPVSLEPLREPARPNGAPAMDRLH